MKKTTRKFLAILMALTLITSVVAMPAFAHGHGGGKPGPNDTTTSEYPTNEDGSTDTSNMTQEQIDAINNEHANDSIHHIDVRIDGTITLQTATDGELTSEQTVNLEITSQPDATYTNGDISMDVSLQQNATPDNNVNGQYEYMQSGDRQSDKYDYGGTVTLVADVTYTKDGKTVETVLEYDEVMTYVDNACGKKDADDSQLGYDVVINATQLTEIITEKTTVTLTKTWDTGGDESVVIPDTITLTNNSTIENGAGEVVHKEVTLTKEENANEDGSWTYTITDVSKDEDITIESESIDGYTSSKVTNESGEEETRLNKNDGSGYWLVNIFNNGKSILNKWFGTSNNTGSEDNTDPTDPEDNTDPTDPEDNTDPTDPEDNTDPTDPEDNTDPTDPEDNTDPTDPEDNTDPTDPEDNTDPTDPKDNTDPTDPEDNTDPSEPKDNTDPTDPKDNTDPTDPKDNTDPSEPKDNTDPSEPEDNTDPAPAPQPENDPAPAPVPMVIDGDGLVEIEDEEVPLAAAPQTGDISLFFAAASLASAGGLLVLNRKRDDEE